MAHATTLQIGGIIKEDQTSGDSPYDVQINMDDQGTSAPYLSEKGDPLSVIATWSNTTNSWVPTDPEKIVNPGFHPNRRISTQDFIDLNSTNFNNAVKTQINEYPTDIQNKYKDLNTFKPYTTSTQTSEVVDPNQNNPTQGTTPPSGTDTQPNEDNFIPTTGVAQIQDFEGTGDPDAGRDLRYPFDHTSAYDFIKIFPMKYIPAMQSGNMIAGTNTLTQGGSASSHFSQVGQRYQHAEKAGSMVFLPMIPASETSSTGWGDQDTMNAIQKEFGIAATNIINDALTNQKDFIDWAANAGGSLMGAAGRLMTPGLGQFITAHFAGKAVGANILGRSGVAINPNLELLFSGPSLREFGYSFTFTPRGKKETQEVRDIIKVFKKGMAPKRTQQHMFLNVPHVWNIEYIYNSKGLPGTWQHPYLNKIKPCALKSFNVDYRPGNSYMTYSDGSMTSYVVSMSFGELEPIYNNDIDMTSNDMGY